MKSDIDMALEPLIKIFKELSISYYICGSVASSAFGISRTTQDIDIVSNIKIESVDTIFEILKKEYFIDKEMILDAINTKTSFNLIHLETMLKLDIFILKNENYHLMTLSRAIEDRLEQNEDSLRIFLSTPEDIILSKLIWYKMGDEISERQWLDIRGVIKIQSKNLDLEYLMQWAKELKVFSLLTKAFSECDIQI